MRVVHVELDAEEEVSDLLGGGRFAIHIAFDFIVLDCARNTDIVIVLVARWRLVLVSIVKLQSDGGLNHASITAFVDEVLHLLCSDHRHSADAHHEANGVEYVGLA